MLLPQRGLGYGGGVALTGMHDASVPEGFGDTGKGALAGVQDPTVARTQRRVLLASWRECIKVGVHLSDSSPAGCWRPAELQSQAEMVQRFPGEMSGVDGLGCG